MKLGSTTWDGGSLILTPLPRATLFSEVHRSFEFRYNLDCLFEPGTNGNHPLGCQSCKLDLGNLKVTPGLFTFQVSHAAVADVRCHFQFSHRGARSKCAEAQGALHVDGVHVGQEPELPALGAGGARGVGASSGSSELGGGGAFAGAGKPITNWMVCTWDGAVGDGEWGEPIQTKVLPGKEDCPREAKRCRVAHRAPNPPVGHRDGNALPLPKPLADPKGSLKTNLDTPSSGTAPFQPSSSMRI